VIHWLEILETGYPEIDGEHRVLVDQCNRLTRLIDEGAAWKEVAAASAALVRDLTAHFRSEERVLDRTVFPRLDEHKAQHDRLEEQFKRLVDFLGTVDGSQPEHWNVAKSLRSGLLDVLFRHDLDYKSHLEQVAGR
jgi:hemerythrin